jgi:hypothetical protein
VEDPSIGRANTIASLRVRDQVDVVRQGLSSEVWTAKQERLKVMVSDLKELDGNDHIGFANADASLHNEFAAGSGQEQSVLIASYQLSVFMALNPRALAREQIIAWHEAVASKGLSGDYLTEALRNPYRFKDEAGEFDKAYKIR